MVLPVILAGRLSQFKQKRSRAPPREPVWLHPTLRDNLIAALEFGFEFSLFLIEQMLLRRFKRAV